jgi:hypothetical protein
MDELTDADLEALRLSAQVMGHKAVVEEHPLVGDFFVRLEEAFRERIAARGADKRLVRPARPALDAAGGDDDRRLVMEYLGLLAANERLSPAVRRVCRELQAAFSR